MTEVTVFIRESDVLARYVKLQNYDVLVNPMVANGENATSQVGCVVGRHRFQIS